jgi:hypothetical protein
MGRLALGNTNHEGILQSIQNIPTASYWAMKMVLVMDVNLVPMMDPALVSGMALSLGNILEDFHRVMD